MVVFRRTEVGKGAEVLGQVAQPGHVVLTFLLLPADEKELQEGFPFFGVDGDRVLGSTRNLGDSFERKCLVFGKDEILFPVDYLPTWNLVFLIIFIRF